MVLGSLDVQALYPSISTKAAGTIVRDRFFNSEAKFDGVDYVWVLKYLALTMSNCENVNARIQGLIPRKISKSGRKPSILSVVTDEVRERWWFPKPHTLLTPEEKRLIVACIGQQLVKVVFGSHFYFWNNELYQYVDSGPMGLMGSSSISRVVMDWWANRNGGRNPNQQATIHGPQN